MNLHLPAWPVHWVEAIMIQKTSFYERQSQHICAIAIDGNNAAEIIDGDLIFRKFYKDAAKTQVDVQKTSDYFLDTVFYETNRVLRTPSKEPYSENRDLKQVPLADIVAKSGKEFQIVYNANAFALPDSRNKNELLAKAGVHANGLALILKKSDADGFGCLSPEEAQTILKEIAPEHH
jgi:hypothetical protein